MFVHVTTYTAKLEGKTLREVTCEKCGQEYVYVLHIRVRGTSSHPYGIGAGAGAANARADAEAKFNKRLKEGVDLAPCPHCGWIQENMLALARRMKRTDYLLLLAAFVAFFAGMALLPVLGNRDELGEGVWALLLLGLSTLCLAGAALFIWRLVAQGRWNPNDAPVERRLAVAAKISVPREEYLKILQRQEGGIRE